MTIWIILWVIGVVIGSLMVAYSNSIYDEEKERELQELQEQKRIASLKIIKCKTCGAPVHITQKCSYCNHQN